MPDVTLSYFDFPGGRGEDCRIALHIAGVPFTDDRVRGADWPQRKALTPYGALPVITVDGRALGQSNAILSFIGRQHELHPADAWEAARHEAVMASIEDLRAQIDATSRGKEGDEKKAAREAFAAGPLLRWAADIEREVVGPFLGGDALQVADLKLFVVMKWFTSGGLDHISADCFSGFPKLVGHHAAARAHPGVTSWYAR